MYGKPGQPQAGRERAQREHDGAHQRPLPQAKDGEAKAHNLSMYRARLQTQYDLWHASRKRWPKIELFERVAYTGLGISVG